MKSERPITSNYQQILTELKADFMPSAALGIAYSDKG
ncbi:hypothetical protein SFB21_2293 [Acinetobacter bouvetii]|uniref:Uncharacterized protein n=1 Tax=Acinetobacter bouvetii TaxID=202951 RepID=A0A811GCQ7_9GAMM|nr:hypothetical protein SFB21_2293 [Acinetobacter bouvetii]